MAGRSSFAAGSAARFAGSEALSAPRCAFATGRADFGSGSGSGLGTGAGVGFCFCLSLHHLSFITTNIHNPQSTIQNPTFANAKSEILDSTLKIPSRNPKFKIPNAKENYKIEI